jgi:hypothetical protein
MDKNIKKIIKKYLPKNIQILGPKDKMIIFFDECGPISGVNAREEYYAIQKALKKKSKGTYKYVPIKNIDLYIEDLNLPEKEQDKIDNLDSNDENLSDYWFILNKPEKNCDFALILE